ncbi:MAG: Loki-CTERM sorting domain-containing protein, partial [Candidatus Hodarchaeota archaeon]
SISSSGDTSFIKGSTGNNFTWTITSNNITNPQYDIYINGFLDDSDIWQNNTPIVVNLDALPVGIYEFKIEAYNTYKTAEGIINVEVHIFDISHPPDINYTVGHTGNTISWVVTSTLVISPTYHIYQDNVSVDTNSWSSGSPIEIDVDGLSVGTYEFRIEVHNSDVVIEDVVTINVEARAEEIIPGYSLLFFLGITSVSMIYLYKKLKKKLHF